MTKNPKTPKPQNPLTQNLNGKIKIVKSLRIRVICLQYFTSQKSVNVFDDLPDHLATREGHPTLLVQFVEQETDALPLVKHCHGDNFRVERYVAVKICAITPFGAFDRTHYQL